MTENAVSPRRRSARERLAHLLCELACRLSGSADDPAVLEAPITPENRADLTGVSGVHLNRSLQALRTEDLLQVSDRAVHILDWPGLMRAGLFNPAYVRLNPGGAFAADGVDRRSGVDGSAPASPGRELNHRVANSVQLASSFLAAQQRRTRDEAARSTLADARTRLEAVGRLHRYLYVHSRNREVDLKTFLGDVPPYVLE